MLKLMRIFVFAIFVGGIISLHGCTMYGVTKVSEPSLPDVGDAQVQLKDDIMWYPDLSVSVKPQNYYVPLITMGVIVPVVPIPVIGVEFKRKGEKFLLLLQMETESEGYAFNPAQVAIQYQNNVYKPSNVRGPYEGGDQLREVARTLPGHKWRCISPKGEPKSGLEARLVHGKACFEIEFPIDTLPPENEFRVMLEGIERNGKALPTTTLWFRPALRGGLTILM